MTSENEAVVRGERVTVVQRDVEDKAHGVLGATVLGADTLVRYDDGELGYVKASELDPVAE